MKKSKTPVSKKASARTALTADAPGAVVATKANPSKYDIQIPESQGDLADRAEIEIEQELQEQIQRARNGATVH